MENENENIVNEDVVVGDNIIVPEQLISTPKQFDFKISACMIVKDEAYDIGDGITCIERCLDSIENKVDEIIIIDTGSTDDTKEKCMQYEKVKLFDSVNFSGDNFTFCGARSESIEKATSEYIFIIDADEELVGHENVLREIIDEDKENSAYYFKNVDVFSEKDKIENETNTRLFKKDCVTISGEVHNFINVKIGTPIKKYDNNLFLHYGYAKTDKRVVRNRQSKALLLKGIANEDNLNIVRAYYNFQLGVVHYGEVDYKNAKKYFKTALRMYDNDNDIMSTIKLRQARETSNENLGILYDKIDAGYVPIQCVAWLHQIACIEDKDFEREIWTRKTKKYIKHFNDIYFYNAQYFYNKKRYAEAKKQLELYIKYYAFEKPTQLISYSASRLQDAVIMLITCIEIV